VVVAVALDAAGKAAVEEFIRPAQILPPMLQFMGWGPDLVDIADVPAYPCLLDERHVAAELYGLVNVPSAVWIDEKGHIVRPAEAPGSSDAFRSMNLATREIPADIAADARQRRAVYVAAVRDWIERGAGSRHVLPPDEVRRRMRGFDPEDSLAAAHFRLGVWLAGRGELKPAVQHLREAVRLRPDSWTIRRQTIVLSDPSLTAQLAATPEFWEAVRALGAAHYYAPTEMEGMPPPVAPRPA
jgi:hypothetical protein